MHTGHTSVAVAYKNINFLHKSPDFTEDQAYEQAAHMVISTWRAIIRIN